jgi:hypothetical protein
MREAKMMNIFKKKVILNCLILIFISQLYTLQSPSPAFGLTAKQLLQMCETGNKTQLTQSESVWLSYCSGYITGVMGYLSQANFFLKQESITAGLTEEGREFFCIPRIEKKYNSSQLAILVSRFFKKLPESELEMDAAGLVSGLFQKQFGCR